MGQNSSSQRDREEFLQRDSRRFSQLVRNRATEETQNTSGQPTITSRGLHAHTLSAPSASLSHHDEGQQNRPLATFSRQISAQSIPQRGSHARSGDAAPRDSIFYEQHEERPLIHMEELGLRDAPITHISATPMPRRTSVISRLGTRLLSRSGTRQSIVQESGTSDDTATRRRMSRSLLARNVHREAAPSNHRLSMLDLMSPRTSTLPRSRRRRQVASISQPYPFIEHSPMELPQTNISPTDGSNPGVPDASMPLFENDELISPLRRSRLSRFRRSLSMPLENLLMPHQSPAPLDTGTSSPTIRQSRTGATPAAEYHLPPLSVAEPQLDFHSLPFSATTSALGGEAARGFPTVSEAPERAATRAESSSWTERWADRAVGTRRDNRRMPSMLRGRSSRLIRRDDDGPLPRILHLAAAAIAAQLSGTPEQAFNNTQAIGAEGLDGSLANLFRTLQLATASTTEVRNFENTHDSPRPLGSQAPMNFLRVFRFVGNAHTEGAATPDVDRAPPQGSGDNGLASSEDSPEGTEGRFVTLVMVGVRSVPSDHVGEDALNAPTLDALLSLPTGPPNNFLRGGPGGLLRHADGRSRFPRRRRASMGGVNPFPANYDSQRHQRLHSSLRQPSNDTTSVGANPVPLALSESPPGPHPPPSTPADPGLSAYSSGATTPSRRPSSASALHNNILPGRDLAAQHLREAGILTPEDQALRAVQQRRRSDSEAARQRDFGAGAARRNGVVEPDEVDSNETPPQGSRSWLIYVVGTNLSEDHPAFATPSLFTDVGDLTGQFPEKSEADQMYTESYLRRYATTIITTWASKTTRCQSGRCSFSSRSIHHPKTGWLVVCQSASWRRPAADISW